MESSAGTTLTMATVLRWIVINGMMRTQMVQQLLRNTALRIAKGFLTVEI